MLLIQIGSGVFVEISAINWISVKDKKVKFSIAGDNQSTFVVDDSFRNKFLETLTKIDCGTSGIESEFYEMDNEVKYDDRAPPPLPIKET
jgi:hypothetical protein